MKPKLQAVSAKTIHELLRDPLWTKNEAFSTLFASGTIYTHPNGRVLDMFSNGRGRLFESQEDFNVEVQRYQELKITPSRHVLKGRLPQGKDFIQHVSQLVNELAILLKIPRDDLDNSEASLDKVDMKVKRIGRAKSLEVPIFPALVAYIGEVMRQATNGKWEMRQAYSDKEIWEPWIIDPEGRSCNPFLAVYDELAEQYPFSIRGATGGRIISRRVLPPPGPPRVVAIYKSSSE